MKLHCLDLHYAMQSGLHSAVGSITEVANLNVLMGILAGFCYQLLNYMCSVFFCKNLIDMHFL